MREKFSTPADKERRYLNREEIVSDLINLLRANKDFQFNYQERSQAALAIIGNKELKEKLRIKRELAIEKILKKLDELEERGRVPAGFFRNLGEKAALAAEIIERLAVENK